MRKGPFLPEDFLPTKFSTAADKAVFGNTLLHSLELNCKRELFTNGLYDRLSNCFGHIAHYVEDVIMRSVNTKIAQTRRLDGRMLRIIPAQICSQKP